MTELKQHLNRETARIAWRDLQTFFASGQVLAVCKDLDLIDVATAIAEDDAARVAQWQQSNKLLPVSDDQAKTWYEANADVWTVVIKPWLLVQNVAPPK